MAFPASWPPRAPSGRRSLRGYAAGTATANYSDNALMFATLAAGSADTFTPLPKIGTENTTTDANSVAKVGTSIVIPPTPWGSGQNDSGAPAPQVWAMGIRIQNTGASTLYLSFDGTNDHGQVAAGKEVTYLYRHEAGVALKGNGTFVLECW